MKKIFIKYNPYMLKTEITVDNKPLADNSVLADRISDGTRLQEWIEDLPDILVDEYNDTDFDVTFHGTLLDYEDVSDVFKRAFDEGKITAKLERIPAKETKDKEKLIDEVFEEIQKGPFDELRSDDIINAFNNAKNDDFEVCVVATMSAGKSTLINAMLGTKLMPSSQEACTAIITRIKDDDDNKWKAEVYDKNGRLLETQMNIDYETMERLNKDEKVSEIQLYGNIPFVQSDGVSLVLIDTPGPNNSRDPEHRATQESFLGKSSKSLILYVMEGTFGSTDDNTLLDRVSESMSVGGKQSKDRFIFVVNKMDDRKKEDGETEASLRRVKEYLENHDIYNPNIFPAAALQALDIRMLSSKQDIDEETIDETEYKVRKLNRNEQLHLEQYAPLPASIKENINYKLKKAEEDNNSMETALIHTGVVSIEAAIRQYVEKYAKTAKIKNIVDTFTHRLDDVGCLEKTKKELASNQENSKQIVERINNIQEKIDDINEAKRFKDAVDVAVDDINDNAKEIVDKILAKYQSKISAKINESRGRELSPDEVNDEVNILSRYANNLQPQFREELDEMIEENLNTVSKKLIEEYKNKLASLTDEIDVDKIEGIEINPLSLMNGSVNLVEISSHVKRHSKEVEDGQEWVKNYEKKWYKPWTWFQKSGYYRTKYKKVEFIKADELRQECLAPIQESIFDNGDLAIKYALKESKHLSEKFCGENGEFARLNLILKNKLNDLKSYAIDKNKAEERIKETELRLNWLEDIKNRVNSILEI